MSQAWQRLADECSRRSDLGRPVEFWLRDDDATRPVPALGRLLALAERAGIPIALAVVPESAEASLFDELSPRVSVLQHGCDHRNRAATGEKKSEFPVAEPVEDAVSRLTLARTRLRELSMSRALPVLVPPWNRLSEGLVPRLRRAGLYGLSRFGPRRGGASAAPGLRQFNTHVDIVAWQAGRGFVGEDMALEQALRFLASARDRNTEKRDEPLGWLTHHACHDEAAWGFLARLFDAAHALPGVRWIAAHEVFGSVATE